MLVGEPSRTRSKRRERSKRSDELEDLVSELTSASPISWTLGCRFPAWGAKTPKAPW